MQNDFTFLGSREELAGSTQFRDSPASIEMLPILKSCNRVNAERPTVGVFARLILENCFEAEVIGCGEQKRKFG
jgi:hypothetical protein